MVRLHAPAAAWLLGIFMGLIWLLCLGALIKAFQHPHRHDDLAEKMALVVILVLLAALLLRIWKSATLTATSSGIVIRTILRTYRIEWADVQEFDEAIRPIGANQIRRRVLRLNMTNGKHRDFTELNCSTRLEPDVVMDAARYLTALAQR